jgi:hypothetical protein
MVETIHSRAARVACFDGMFNIDVGIIDVGTEISYKLDCGKRVMYTHFHFFILFYFLYFYIFLGGF